MVDASPSTSTPWKVAPAPSPADGVVTSSTISDSTAAPITDTSVAVPVTATWSTARAGPPTVVGEPSAPAPATTPPSSSSSPTPAIGAMPRVTPPITANEEPDEEQDGGEMPCARNKVGWPE